MVGTRLADRYEIVRELGRGGMGVVYLARDPVLDREVAVKVIQPASLTDDAAERFRREARLVARLDHPGIVGIHDFGCEGSSFFYVMPHVRGRDLRQAMQERALTLGEILEIGRAIAEALQYSHAAGIVHRDIKPENVLIDGDASLRVRVTDFGLAIAGSAERLTGTGRVVGTVSYLAPEQLTRADIDNRTDIYALGTLLYELLCGRLPFSGEMARIVYRIAHEQPQPPRDLTVAMPADVEEVVMRCLQKQPSARPQRAQEIADVFMRCIARLRDSDELSQRHPTAALRSPDAGPALMGREKELTQLQESFNAARAGTFRFVTISGEAGIGKTRLVEELEHVACASRVTVLRGRFADIEESLPYSALCGVIQEYFRLRGHSDPAADFADLAPELTQNFPLLSEIAALRSTRRETVPAAARSQTRAYLFDLLARTYVRIVGTQPFVIVLEDMQAAEVSIHALEYIIHCLRALPVMLIATYRSDEIDQHHPATRMVERFEGDRHFASIRLGPLSFAEHARLVASMLGSMQLDEAMLRRTYETAEGRPHFTRELVRSLVDSGELAAGRSGTWSLARDAAIAADTLPATFRQTVERRLQRLPKRQRDLLATAAVIGRTFELRELEALLGGAGSIDDDIDFLLAAGFIEEERGARADRMTFSSGVMRSVLYADLPRRTRRTLHRQYAELLERRHTALPAAYPQLVHHYAAADAAEKVIRYGLLLARHSVESFSADDAINSAKTVLDFADEPHVIAEARTLLAQAYRFSGRSDAALAELDAAAQLYAESADDAALLALTLLGAEIAWQGGRAGDARPWVESGLVVARRTGDRASLAKLLSVGAVVANLRGDYDIARRYLDEKEALQPSRADVAGEVRRSGTVQIPCAFPVGSLELIDANFMWEADVIASVFETLTQLDDEARVVGRLAESLAAEDGGRRYRFRLREGVEFHDGRPLTARDVQWSFERLLLRAPAWNRRFLIDIRGGGALVDGRTRQLEGIHIVSAHELIIELETPLSFFPAILSHPVTGIVPEGTGDLGNDWRSGCVGTGPFRVTRFEAGKRLELEANPRYWRRGYPRAEGVAMSLGLDSGEIASRFASARLSIACDLSAADYRRLRQSAPAVQHRETPCFSTGFLILNNVAGPLQDRQLRRTLIAAIETATLVSRELGGVAIPATGMIPPGLLGHEPRTHFAASGFAARSRETIELTAGLFSIFSTSHRGYADLVLRSIEAAGFRVRVGEPDDRSLRANTVHFDISFYRWYFDFPDSHSIVHGVLKGLSMLGQHPDIDELIARAASELRPEIRHDLYREIEEIVAREALLVPLFHEKTYAFAQPNVEGFTVRRFFPSIPLEELSIVRRF